MVYVKACSSKIGLFVSSICLILYITEICIVFYDSRAVNSSAPTVTPNKVIDVVGYASLYRHYLAFFDKSYNASETARRFENFKASLTDISRRNEDSSAFYGWTKFTDMSYRDMYPNLESRSLGDCTGLARSCDFENEDFDCQHYLRNKTIPDKFDWRDHGKVGAVLDQRKCNGCWAFGIAGVMESMAAIQEKKDIVSLSIQELLDCINSTKGCQGGHANIALSWLCTYADDVVPDHEYPLRLVKESCNVLESSYIRRVKQYCQLCDPNEEDILRLVAHHGPVLTVVNAQPWLNYIDGVIQKSCYRSKSGTTLDHVVQIVGYDKTAPVPHYIIRNSWGDDFGAGGYVKLALYNNVCGVADEIYALDVYIHEY